MSQLQKHSIHLQNKLIKYCVSFFLGKKDKHKIPYITSYTQFLIQRFFQNDKLEKEYDLVFVIDEGNRGWILEAICKEIATYFPGKCYFSYSKYFPNKDIFSYSPKNLPLPP